MTGALVNTRRTADGAVIVEIRGDVDVSSAQRLREVLTDSATRLRPTRIVVDLLHVTFIDSTGVGALVAGHNAAAGVGIRLTVRHASPFVAARLRQIGLDAVLPHEA